VRATASSTTVGILEDQITIGARREGTESECARLEARVFSVKQRFLGMYRKANAGHVGSSLSCAEILVFLKFAWMNESDELILSKGHAAAALYSLLAEVGRLSDPDIASYYQDGTRLPALPPFNTFPEIPLATGSLGHGLSVSAGMALGARLRRRNRRIFCVTSDGELDEGSTWEAALFIAHHKLRNLVWVIDRNQIQAIGRTEDVLALEPLDLKLRAFGFHVVSVQGHDFAELLTAREECTRVLDAQGAPVVIIANTVKGNGIRELQDSVDSHYLPLTDAQFGEAMDELSRAYAARVNR
jgi:transketolase